MDNFLNRVNENETVRNFLNQVNEHKIARKFADIVLIVVYCVLIILATYITPSVLFLGEISSIVWMLGCAAVTFYIGRYFLRRSSRWLVPLAVSPALFSVIISILIGGAIHSVVGLTLSPAVHGWGWLAIAFAILFPVFVLVVGTCHALIINASCRREVKKLRSSFVELVQQGKKEPVAEALQRGADANAADADGVPALVHALGNMEISKLLLEHGANAKAAVNVANAKGVPVLLPALNDGEIFKLLLGHGADVNASDEAGKTALMYAIEMGNMEAAKLLLAQGANINAADAQGQTLLEYAMKAENMEAASLLLDLGAPIDVAKDGCELLALAAKNNDMELARRLVNMGVDPQAATQGA